MAHAAELATSDEGSDVGELGEEGFDGLRGFVRVSAGQKLQAARSGADAPEAQGAGGAREVVGESGP